MRKILWIGFATWLLCGLGVSINRDAEAKIYKYKNDRGEWCFTNDPSVVPDRDFETEEFGKTKAPPDLERRIAEKCPVRSRIDQARNATVAIKSTMGLGSGFFIAESGYILTNKHVVTLPEDSRTRMEQSLQELRAEKERLEREYGHILEEEKELERHRGEQGYQASRRRLDAWKNQCRKRKKTVKDKLERLKGVLRNTAYPYSLRIYLADDTEFSVSILSTSTRYDLALMKLQGYKTPYIEPGDAGALSHGDPLFAIGSPISLSLKHTVTSGVFSGLRRFEEGPLPGEYIQTNAQINRGNSGGPLVTEEGMVVGINTWKVFGQETEGLNFAIPIGIALKEFYGYLGLE